MSYKYGPGFHERHPWVCHLYWFPPIYLVGLFIAPTKDWCKEYINVLIVEMGFPVHTLWWPGAMHRFYSRL